MGWLTARGAWRGVRTGALQLRCCAIALLLATGCVPPGQLSSACKDGPSSAVWNAVEQTGRIEGTISDMSEDLPIGNMEVRLSSRGGSVRTDAAGSFRFDGVGEGRHVLVSTGAGYPIRTDTVLVPASGGVRGEIRLSTSRDVVRRCPLYKP